MKLLFLYMDGIANRKTQRGGSVVTCDRGGSACSVVRATPGALGASAWREERGRQQQGRLRDGASARHQGVARSGVVSVRLPTPPL